MNDYKWEPKAHLSWCSGHFDNGTTTGAPCDCAKGTRVWESRHRTDSEGLQGLCSWFARLQVPVAWMGPPLLSGSRIVHQDRAIVSLAFADAGLKPSSIEPLYAYPVTAPADQQEMCGCGDSFGDGSVCANCLCGKYVEATQQPAVPIDGASGGDAYYLLENASAYLRDIAGMIEEADAIESLAAQLAAEQAERAAFAADVRGSEQKDLSFAMACVRSEEGITVRGALDAQRNMIADLRQQLAAAQERRREIEAQPAAVPAATCPECGCPEFGFHLSGCPRLILAKTTGGH